MLELIDRNELIRFFENDADRHTSSLNKYERNYANAMLVAAKNVKVFPGVDAVKVVHGRWLKAECSEKDGNSNCSNCGQWDWDDRKYCHNCGAKMDGDARG